MKQYKISFGRKGREEMVDSTVGARGILYITERFTCLCLPEGDI